MAANSKREQLILRVKWEMDQLIPSSLRFVTRRLPSGFEELQSYASTQLPMVAVVGNLPSPIQEQGGSRGSGPDCRLIKWNLDVYVFGYFMDNVDPDSTLSDLSDDIFRALNLDPTKNNLAIGTKVVPSPAVGIWEPYVAFKMVCKITYLNSLGGL